MNPTTLSGKQASKFNMPLSAIFAAIVMQTRVFPQAVKRPSQRAPQNSGARLMPSVPPKPKPLEQQAAELERISTALHRDEIRQLELLRQWLRDRQRSEAVQ
jgi:hypothetical protein